jgi:predicted chitinase
MDANTLRNMMSYPGYGAPLSLARYAELVRPLTIALHRAGCTTGNRVSMFAAQIGAESGSLRWTEELASGAAYNWRSDLGNNYAGDGPRYKGRSFIQITGRANYAMLSRWAHREGYVPTDDYFLNNPYALANDEHAFLGPVWYWTVARNMNAYADRGDVYGATLAVNGGTNNLSGRTARWNKCRSLGNAVLPGPPPPKELKLDPDVKAQFALVNHKIDNLYKCFVGSDGAHHTVEGAVAHVTQGATYATRRGHLWTRLFRTNDRIKK